MTDERARLTAGLIPAVPSEEARLAINRLFGSGQEDEDADRHMEHWNRGKQLQASGAPVPYRHEDEFATGFYDREIRPVLLLAFTIWMAERVGLPGRAKGARSLEELVSRYFDIEDVGPASDGR